MNSLRITHSNLGFVQFLKPINLHCIGLNIFLDLFSPVADGVLLPVDFSGGAVTEDMKQAGLNSCVAVTRYSMRDVLLQFEDLESFEVNIRERFSATGLAVDGKIHPAEDGSISFDLKSLFRGGE